MFLPNFAAPHRPPLPSLPSTPVSIPVDVVNSFSQAINQANANGSRQAADRSNGLISPPIVLIPNPLYNAAQQQEQRHHHAQYRQSAHLPHISPTFQSQGLYKSTSPASSGWSKSVSHLPLSPAESSRHEPSTSRPETRGGEVNANRNASSSRPSMPEHSVDHHLPTENDGRKKKGLLKKLSAPELWKVKVRGHNATSHAPQIPPVPRMPMDPDSDMHSSTYSAGGTAMRRITRGERALDDIIYRARRKQEHFGIALHVVY